MWAMPSLSRAQATRVRPLSVLRSCAHHRERSIHAYTRAYDTQTCTLFTHTHVHAYVHECMHAHMHTGWMHAITQTRVHTHTSPHTNWYPVTVWAQEREIHAQLFGQRRCRNSHQFGREEGGAHPPGFFICPTTIFATTYRFRDSRIFKNMQQL
jgi:hypothetical protein